MIDVVKIYYNLCCFKSCEMLSLLQSCGIDFEVVFYFEMLLDVGMLCQLLQLLGMESFCEFMCQKEDLYKLFNLVDLVFSNVVLIQVMVDNLKFIECFIVVSCGQVCIGCLLEQVFEIVS